MGSEKTKDQGCEAAGFMRSSDDVEEPRKITSIEIETGCGRETHRAMERYTSYKGTLSLGASVSYLKLK